MSFTKENQVNCVKIMITRMFQTQLEKYGHFVNLNVSTLVLKTAQDRREASVKSPSSPSYCKPSHK